MTIDELQIETACSGSNSSFLSLHSDTTTTTTTRKLHKTWILILICLLISGSCFSYDSIDTLEVTIEQVMSISTADFTSLNAFYSWPNVLMCLIGGQLVDRVLGIRKAAIVFNILLVIGQLTVSLGAFSNQFRLMQLGRLIFGLGGESLIIAQASYVSLWFDSRETSTIFGICATIASGSAVLSINVSHPIFNFFKQNFFSNQLTDHYSLGCTLLIPALFCSITLCFSIILAYLDKRAEKILHRNRFNNRIDNNCITLSDIGKFRIEFWLLNAIIIFFWICLMPFIALGSAYFQKKWLYSATSSDSLVGLAYFSMAILSPFVGLIIDKTGRNLFFILLSCFILMLSHFLFAITMTIKVWIPMILIGFAYATMNCAYWPIVSMAVNKNLLGTAYGVIQALQNFGIALGSNFTGLLADWKGYIIVELFFTSCAGLALILCIILILIDNNKESSLNKSAYERCESKTITVN